jgi:hypothetical protein
LEGDIPMADVQKAIKDLDIDPEKPFPSLV